MEESVRGPSADGTGGDQESPLVLLESLAARSPEPVVILDGTGTVVAGNEPLWALLEQPPGSLEGEPLSAVFDGVPLAAVERHCSEDATGEYLTASSTDGSLWVELAFSRHQWDGETYYLGTAHDITERRQREGRLAEYERIIETVEDGVYALDETFTIRTVNSAVESMTGYDADQLVGSPSTLLADESTLERAAELSEELAAGDRDVATLTTTIQTADGDRLPIETRFSAYTDADGRAHQVGVIRDISDRRRFARTLAALHDTTRELLEDETAAEVESTIVHAATNVLELDGAAVYRFDSDRSAVERTTAAVADGRIEADRTASLGPGDGAVWRAFVEDERRAIDADAVADADPTVLTDSGVAIPLDEHGVLVAATPADLDRRTRELLDLLAANARAALARVDREAALRDRTDKLQDANERLGRLEQVNGIIRRIDRVLVEAETRAEIEQAVCDELVAANWFKFAWLGQVDGGTVVPQSWAGSAASYLDDVSLSTDGEGGPPAVRTARTNSTTVVPTIAEGLRGSQWRTEALTREFQSAISVPLEHDGFVYGVLTVYADEHVPFGDRVQSVFAELGATIANVLREIESRQPSSGDRAVELRLSTPAPSDPTTALVDRLGSVAVCEGAVPGDGERTRQFVRMPGTDPDTVESCAAGLTRVESVGTVSADDGLFELVVSGPTVPRTLVDQGARLERVEFTAECAEATVSVAPGTDVREFVERFRSRYPDAQLIARTERQDPERLASGPRGALTERLTDRQLEVLQTAYLSGFYEWPRATTGEELASMLDVSQPTVNRHLRVGQRKLFGLVFGDEQG